MRALMTQKSCAVWMRNAILRIYLKTYSVNGEVQAGNYMKVAGLCCPCNRQLQKRERTGKEYGCCPFV